MYIWRQFLLSVWSLTRPPSISRLSPKWQTGCCHQATGSCTQLDLIALQPWCDCWKFPPHPTSCRGNLCTLSTAAPRPAQTPACRTFHCRHCISCLCQLWKISIGTGPQIHFLGLKGARPNKTSNFHKNSMSQRSSLFVTYFLCLIQTVLSQISNFSLAKKMLVTQLKLP